MAAVVGATMVVSPALTPRAEAQAGPSPLFVTPNTGLADGQSVMVEGYGWDPNATLTVEECLPSLDCDPATSMQVTTDGAGSFSDSFTVREVINPASAAGTDCGTTICMVVVSDQSFSKVAFWAILFGPAPTVTATPDTGLVDGQTVAVQGTNWPPGIEIDLFQCSDEYGRCVLLPSVTSQPDGTFTASVTVQRVIELNFPDPIGSFDCVTDGPCSLGAGSPALPGVSIAAPIAFAPGVNTPPDKAACKNDGWQQYTDDLGTAFKNQGECVSYVAAAGGDLANG